LTEHSPKSSAHFSLLKARKPSDFDYLVKEPANKTIKRRFICGLTILVLSTGMGGVMTVPTERDYLIWTSILKTNPVKQVMSINPVLIATCQASATPHAGGLAF